MKANTIGDLWRENWLRVQFLLNSGANLATITPDLTHVDGIGMVIVVEDASRVITANGTTDHVVKATKTWVFAGGNFGQGDVGATVVIAGTSGGSNDGTYHIATVVNSTTFTSTEAVPGANETFTTSVTATVTDLPLQATIEFDVSNDYVQTTLPGLNQVPTAGHWADITSAFAPAFADITVAGNQYAQAYPLVARRGKLIIKPTAGASLVSIYYSAKGNR